MKMLTRVVVTTLIFSRALKRALYKEFSWSLRHHAYPRCVFAPVTSCSVPDQLILISKQHGMAIASAEVGTNEKK